MASPLDDDDTALSMQLRTLQLFTGGPDSVFVSCPAAAKWLLRSPRDSLSLSPDAIRQACLLELREGRTKVLSTEEGAGCGHARVMLVPHSVLDRNVVIGYGFMHAPLPFFGAPGVKSTEKYNNSFRMDSTTGYGMGLCLFVMALETGGMYWANRTLDGKLALTLTNIRSDSFSGCTQILLGRGGEVEEVLFSDQVCNICGAVEGWDGLCACEPSNQSLRKSSKPSGLVGWSGVLEMIRAGSLPKHDIQWRNQNGSPLPPGMPLREECEFLIDDHPTLLDCRAVYLNFLSVWTLQIASELTFKEPPALSPPDVSSYLADDFLSGIDVDLVSSSGEDVDLLTQDESIEGLLNDVFGVSSSSATPTSDVAKLGRRKDQTTLVGLQCPHCETVCSKKQNLVRHIRSAHENMKQFSCPHCSRSFAQKVNMLRHVKNIHLL